MKILLINPPTFHEIKGFYMSFIDNIASTCPPIGLLYLASYLEKNSAHQATVLDACLHSMTYEKIKSVIIQNQPDVVGITVMTTLLIDACKTAKLVKEVNSKTPVIFGGPHTGLYPNETINFSFVDFLVLGEGEKTLCSLLNNIDNYQKLSSIPGIVFKHQEKIINSGPPSFIMDLDQLPLPARTLTPHLEYKSSFNAKDINTTIITSRGCPFNCYFCNRICHGKKFRAHSAEYVVNELEQCLKLGIRDFSFYDDTFTVNKERVIKICQYIVQKKLNIKWNIRTRIDTVDATILRHLKMAGCTQIHYGIEAGTQKALKALNKNISIKQAKTIFELTRRNKMKILAYFMINNPGENREDILSTFKVAKALKPNFIHLSILSPFPSTHIYEQGLLNGTIKSDYWKNFSADPSCDFSLPMLEQGLLRNEIQQLLIFGYKDFYLRPIFILKKLSCIRSIRELIHLSYFGIKLMLSKTM